MEHEYLIVVSNIGNVLCSTLQVAQDTFAKYVAQSKRPNGRASNEQVCLMVDGEIVQEYFPE